MPKRPGKKGMEGTGGSLLGGEDEDEEEEEVILTNPPAENVSEGVPPSGNPYADGCLDSCSLSLGDTTETKLEYVPLKYIGFSKGTETSFFLLFPRLVWVTTTNILLFCFGLVQACRRLSDLDTPCRMSQPDFVRGPQSQWRKKSVIPWVEINETRRVCGGQGEEIRG